MCPAEGETAVGAASATQRKEHGVSQGRWESRGTMVPQDCKDSQDYRAAKETRVNGGFLDQLDQKEMWEREASLDSPVQMEFLGTQGKVGPEEDQATTVAMEPGETLVPRGPLDPGAFLASLGPKDPRGRKVNLMHSLQKTATNTGVNLGSLASSATRGLLATQGQQDRWVL